MKDICSSMNNNIDIVTSRRNRFILLLPLFIIELYLLFSLALLQFGPITWNLHNGILFWIFIISYHLSFILGYLYTVGKCKNNVVINHRYTINIENIIIRYFWIIWFMALVASLIMYKNGVNNLTIVPDNLFEKVYIGLVSYGEARGLASASYALHPNNTVFVTFFYAITAVFRYSLLPIIIFFWNRLTNCRKLLGTILALFPIAVSLSTGTSAYAIFVFFVSFLSTIILVLRTYYLRGKLKKFKRIAISLISIILICITIFLVGLASRLPSIKSLHSLELAAPPGDMILSNAVEESSIIESISKIDFYLVQGYYGMSLALSEDFTSTYGFGSSLFLVRFFDKHLGTDLNTITYQHKISNKWNEYSVWHSFYSQVANDFSFFGMIVYMFILGAIFASVYISGVIYNNIFAKLLLPLFGIMFLFMPMNNQIGNIMEFLISFVILLFLWIKSRLKLQISN